MKYSTVFLSLLAGASAAATEPVINYDGYKVFRVPVATEEFGATLDKLSSSLGLSVWKNAYGPGDHADIAVPPSVLSAFQRKAAGLTNLEVMHENLGQSIAEESTFQAYDAGTANLTWFDAYHPYKDHVAFLKNLQSQYSANSALISTGTSGEGRDIEGIHIYGPSKGKKAIVFHGTIHAREWIVGMVLEYIAWYLLSNSGKDDVKGFLDKYDIFIFPIVNPDGFVFSQTNDRMWRKNRSKNGNSNCRGTDGNRNWAYKWSGKGSSTDPCNEQYRGASEGSEPEVKGLSAFLNKLQKSQGVRLYIDWHSYSQLILFPYGFTCNENGPRHQEHQTFGTNSANALKAVHGTSFRVGTACKALYQIAGGSIDYAIDVSKVDYAYLYELRDTGKNGFVLPANQIKPSGEETWAAVKSLFNDLAKR